MIQRIDIKRLSLHFYTSRYFTLSIISYYCIWTRFNFFFILDNWYRNVRKFMLWYTLWDSPANQSQFATFRTARSRKCGPGRHLGSCIKNLDTSHNALRRVLLELGKLNFLPSRNFKSINQNIAIKVIFCIVTINFMCNM